jgi:hypothetical protein
MRRRLGVVLRILELSALREVATADGALTGRGGSIGTVETSP